MVVKDLENLVTVLQDLRHIHVDLIICLRNEQESLKNFDSDLLAKVIHKKNKILSAISVIEANRQALFDKVCEGIQIDGCEPQIGCLLELAERSPQPYRDQLISIRASLRRLTKWVGELSQVNEMVVEESMKRIKAIRVHLSSLVGLDSYNASGKLITRL
jgi:hypothetical protein